MLGALRLEIFEVSIVVLLGQDESHVGVELIVVFIFGLPRVLLADEDGVSPLGRYLHCDVVRFALVVRHSQRAVQVHWVQLADVYCPVELLEVLPTDEETTVVGVRFDLVLFFKLWGPLSGLLRPGSFPYHIAPRVPQPQHSLILYLMYAQQRIGMVTY